MKKQEKQTRQTSGNCQCYIQVYIYSYSGNLHIWCILTYNNHHRLGECAIWNVTYLGSPRSFYLENVCLQQQESASLSETRLAKPLEAWQSGFPYKIDHFDLLVDTLNLFVKCHGEQENHKMILDYSKTAFSQWEICIDGRVKKWEESVHFSQLNSKNMCFITHNVVSTDLYLN